MFSSNVQLITAAPTAIHAIDTWYVLPFGLRTLSHRRLLLTAGRITAPQSGSTLPDGIRSGWDQTPREGFPENIEGTVAGMGYVVCSPVIPAGAISASIRQ